MNPPDIRFSADAMSQSLAKWIRLLGYDCDAGDDLFGRKLAVKNRAHARLNPLAQIRDDELAF